MIRRTIAFLAMFAVTLGAGAYAAIFGKSEMIHFWVAAPAGYVRGPRMAAGGKQPIRLAPITIDLDRRGFLKRWIQPDVEGISTHWIHNVGKKPLRIRMEIVEGGVPVSWEVKADFPYDPKTHTFTAPLQPGQSIPSLAIDWLFQLPCANCPLEARKSGKKCSEMIYNGGLKLTDADTGELLTFIPIRIGRGIAAVSGRPTK